MAGGLLPLGLAHLAWAGLGFALQSKPHPLKPSPKLLRSAGISISSENEKSVPEQHGGPARAWELQKDRPLPKSCRFTLRLPCDLGHRTSPVFAFENEHNGIKFASSFVE